MLTTEFTRRFDIEHPIIQPGMGSICGARLAAAVSNAGALGTIGSIGRTPDALAAEIRACQHATDRPFAVNVATFDWAPFAAGIVDAAIDAGAEILTLSFGDFLPALERCKSAGRKTIVQVQDMAGAEAALAAGADAVIAQGNEAGGHTGPRGTLSFAAQVLRIAGDTPVLLAGGIADGRGLAAALAMGAGGASIGTRFKATPEFGPDAFSEVVEAQKAAIVASDGANTLFDDVFDTAIALVWPEGISGRALRNDFSAEWQGRLAELRERVAAGPPGAFGAGIDASPRTSLNWAGESAGLVDRVMPAAEIVAEVVREAEVLLRRAAGLVT
jgi:nitronate monooxygenase